MPKINQMLPSGAKKGRRELPKGSDPVQDLFDRLTPIDFKDDDSISLLIYGRPGTGKTTLWGTFPKPIAVAICSGGLKPGELRSLDSPENRGGKIKSVVLRHSEELRDLCELQKRKGLFKTLVLDHVTGFQDLLLKEVLGLDKIPAQKSWGMASDQIWGKVGGTAKDIIRDMLDADANIVAVAQQREFKHDETSELNEIIAPWVGAGVIPTLAGFLHYVFDYTVQTFKRPAIITKRIKKRDGTIKIRKTRGEGIEYCIRTAAHDTYETKFRIPRGRELPDVIVDPTYEKIHALIYGKDEEK